MEVRYLTDKQKWFCDEYLIDLNATRAYKAAYPHVKNNAVAQANGSRLLSNAKVKLYIDELLEKLHNEKVADAGEVLEYLMSVMRGEIKSEIVVVEAQGDFEQVVSIIDAYNIVMSDRVNDKEQFVDAILF